MIVKVIVLSIYQREDTYIKLLSEKSRTVKELSGLMYVSEPTVRRDIAEMKNKDIVACNRGSVSLKINSPDKRTPLFLRDGVNNEKKQIIASKAAKHIKDGYVIMLDASTSAYCLIPHLAAFRNIICITNGAKSAIALASMGIKTICCGGEIVGDSFCYIGSEAEAMLNSYNADVAFFSCSAVDENGIASDTSIGENNIRRIMIKNSRKCFLLCDSSKFNKRHLNILCDVKDINGIISE